jgi:glycosyltransferase involved in cell wall biosynthesis
MCFGKGPTMPIVSVVIPVAPYNDEKYKQELSEAIQSVFKQTYTDYEIVLVDNNATKEVKTILDKYASMYSEKIRVVNEPTQGNPSARNAGIMNAKGEYIALLDSDDCMYPDRLQRQYDVSSQNKTYSMVASWVDWISPEGNEIVEKGSDIKPEVWAKYLWGHTLKYQKDPYKEPRPSTFFFRKKIAIEVGLFDVRYSPNWLEDSDFLLRMYEYGPIRIIEKPLVAYRMHSQEKSRKRNLNLVEVIHREYFFKDLKRKYFDKNDVKTRGGFFKLQSRWLREAGEKFFAYDKGIDIGKSLTRKAFYSRPLDFKNAINFFRSFLPRNSQPKPFNISERIPGELPEYCKEVDCKNLFSLD